MEQRTSSGGLAPALAILGGVLVMAGSVLDWATASAGGFSTSAKGINGWEGKVTIVCGISMVIAGVSSFVGATGGKNRLRVSALVGGAGAAAISIYSAMSAEDQVIDGVATELAKQQAVAVEIARAAVQEAIDRGQFAVSLEIGIYLVIVGGIIGIVAAILAMMSRSAAPRAPAPAAGLTGWSAPAAPYIRPPMPSDQESASEKSIGDGFSEGRLPPPPPN
ncbi:MAG: hypothetical protein AB1551_00785 [Actinomycetota bacterium]